MIIQFKFEGTTIKAYLIVHVKICIQFPMNTLIHTDWNDNCEMESVDNHFNNQHSSKIIQFILSRVDCLWAVWVTAEIQRFQCKWLVFITNFQLVAWKRCWGKVFFCEFESARWAESSNLCKCRATTDVFIACLHFGEDMKKDIQHTFAIFVSSLAIKIISSSSIVHFLLHYWNSQEKKPWDIFESIYRIYWSIGNFYCCFNNRRFHRKRNT